MNKYLVITTLIFTSSFVTAKTKKRKIASTCDYSFKVESLLYFSSKNLQSFKIDNDRSPHSMPKEYNKLIEFAYQTNSQVCVRGKVEKETDAIDYRIDPNNADTIIIIPTTVSLSK